MLANAVRKVTPWVLAALLAPGMWACSGSPSSPGGKTGGGWFGGGGGNGATPQAAPGLGVNPSNLGQGGPPAQVPGSSVSFADPNNLPFVDPTTDQGKASSLFFAGTWAPNGGYLEQSTGARQASLTFRQYAGEGFGSQGGVAPAHYRSDVTAWVYQPSDQYPNMVGAPLGIVGYAPYFKDETHYMLVVAKPTSLEAWAVDGFVPGSEWPVANRLWSQPLDTPLAVGTPIAWAVEIDTASQSAKIFANNEEKVTVSHPMLTNSGQRVALISNGNYLHFQDFKVFRF